MRWILASWLVCLASSLSLAQTEAERNAARAAFQSGVEHYSGERYTEALSSFQEAYRIAPHPSVRVNMANCYEQLNRPVEAIFHFERFLVEAEDASPAQRTEVRTALRRLRELVGEIFLRVSPEGAAVTIDGTETRRAPIMDAIRLPAGMHRIEVQADGFRSSSQEVIVTGRQRTEVRIELTPGPTRSGTRSVIRSATRSATRLVIPWATPWAIPWGIPRAIPTPKAIPKRPGRMAVDRC